MNAAQAIAISRVSRMIFVARSLQHLKDDSARVHRLSLEFGKQEVNFEL